MDAYVSAALAIVPMLVWAIIARQAWEYRLRSRPRSGLVRLTPIVATVFALNYLFTVVWTVTPMARAPEPFSSVASPFHVVNEALWLVTLALLRHLCQLVPVPEERPSRSWLLTNYGGAALIVSADAFLRLYPPATFDHHGPGAGHHVFEIGFLIFGLAALRQLARVARPGAWILDPAGEARRGDLRVIAWGAAAACLSFPIFGSVLGWRTGSVVFETILGLALAAPFALRVLGVVVPAFLASAALLGAIAAVLGLYGVALAAVEPQFRPLVHVVTLLVLGLVMAQGQRWLRTRIARLVLRRNLLQQTELQAFLHTLSPELGVLECCRRALAELVRVRQVRGGAIVLTDGQSVTHGTFHLEPLVRAWPRGGAAEALPAVSLGTDELRELPRPLRDALLEAGVGMGTLPIASPRRRWGHLFLSTGPLGGILGADDVDLMRGFVAQLALVLDAADLLARAVAVERSLAHAEKLAAIGELAARVAHEIRNPITAARSLAQQVGREAGAPFAAEHALILAELERVERQIGALLRFARRDELRIEPVDLGELARTTLQQLRPQLAAAGIAVDLAVAEGVWARADREKLRQVLINLIENAIDALAEKPGDRHLHVEIAAVDGRAALSVADDGPGVAADALPRLFDPFFSLKPSGTGLGLAIARRTVEAHGGRIGAVGRPGGGLTLAVELPRAAGAA